MSQTFKNESWEGELLSSGKKSKKSFLNLVHSNEEISGEKNRFSIMTLEELLSIPPQKFLVGGIFPEKGVACIYGAPGSGKTFLVLDLALSLASGKDQWCGRAVRPGKVVYIAGEGLTGVAARTRSWVKEYCNPDAQLSVDFFTIQHPPNLLMSEDVHRVAATCKQIQPSLIIIDTLSRATVGGDENSAKDMGIAVDGAISLSKKVDCLVILIHHTSKAGGERGSGALRANVDAIVEVKRNGEARELVLNDETAKLKDSGESENICFKLETRGESCIIVPTSIPPSQPRPIGADQRLVFELAGRALAESSNFNNAGKPVITFQTLLKKWQAVVETTRKKEPGALRRALSPMLARGVLLGDENEISCP